MTRGQIRSLLRKRIQEDTADQWSDTDLNLLIELALQDLEREVLAQRGDAFTRISTAPWTEAKTRYLLPAGNLRILSVEVRTSTSAAYKKIRPRRSSAILEANSTGTTTAVNLNTVYSVFGKWLEINPAPDTTVDAGIRIRWVPSLVMDDDSVVSEIELPLHEAIVYGAKEKAFEETEEEAKDAREKKEVIYGSIPRYYRRMDESADVIEIAGIDTYRDND